MKLTDNTARVDSLVTEIVAILRNNVASNQEIDEVLLAVSRLSKVENPALGTYDQETWAPVLLGDDGLLSGIVLRVKNDAYSEGSSTLHNGRRGVFACARSGYVYITYDGVSGGSPAPHRPEKVERLA